eukprot:Rhum_TRINITY_DN10081_c1_g1::Rhum_TRINITY_DN10081_c1_g1_i1::g.36707::m.36707
MKRAAQRSAACGLLQPLRRRSSIPPQQRQAASASSPPSLSTLTGISGAFLGRFPSKDVDVDNAAEFLNGVPFLDETATLQEAARFLAKIDAGAVPVLATAAGAGVRRVVGMLSERDIARAFATEGGDVVRLSVRECMTKEVVFCDRNDSLKAILATMLEHNFRHLPCVDSHGTLVGLVSMRDAAWAQSREQNDEATTIDGVDEFLAHISNVTRV